MSPSANKPPQPKPGILDIAPYVPGKSTLKEDVPIAKLSSNESPLGCSPNANAALANLTGKLQEYPDASSSNLREAIANVYGLNADNLICGNGSDDILSMLANTYLGPGDEAIHTEHGFLYYPIVIRAAGATPIVAPELEFTANVDSILNCVGERTKLVFLANPNNPTGTYIPISEIRRLQENLPSHVLLVIDAAYAEYVQRNDYEAGIELVSANSNVVMTRTFSKIHGLAALRIGWAYASHDIIDALNRIRGPFNVNAAAIVAAIAAVKDLNHIDNSVDHNGKWLPWLTEKLQKLDLEITPSVGNFILIHFPEGPRSAANADQMLQSEGCILRAVTGYGFPNALRMTIGTEEENQKIVRLLTSFMTE